MNATHTDIQLKQALAKMLPDVIDTEWTNLDGYAPEFYGIYWKQRPRLPHVLDTELLHLCWLVEESLTRTEYSAYHSEFWNVSTRQTHSASWQQRTIALAKIYGIEIV